MKFKSFTFPVFWAAACCKARSHILHLLGPVHDGEKCGLATHFGLDVSEYPRQDKALAWLCAVGLGLASCLFFDGKSSRVVENLVFDYLREYLGAQGCKITRSDFPR